MRWECQKRFPRYRLQSKPLVNDPGMNHGTCVTQVQWCMLSIANQLWRGKRSRHSRRMRNPQVYLSGKSPCRDSSVLLSKWITTVLNCVTFASQATYHPLIDSLLVIIIAGRKHHYHYHYFYIIIYNTHRSTYNVAVWHPVSIIKFCWSFVESCKIESIFIDSNWCNFVNYLHRCKYSSWALYVVDYKGRVKFNAHLIFPDIAYFKTTYPQKIRFIEKRNLLNIIGVDVNIDNKNEN